MTHLTAVPHHVSAYLPCPVCRALTPVRGAPVLRCGGAVGKWRNR